MKKILLRGDAGPTIGSGNLTALIHLSKRFQANGWETHFMIRDYAAGKKLAGQHRLEPCHWFPRGFSMKEEVEEINTYLEHNAIGHFLGFIAGSLTEYANLPAHVFKACICCHDSGTLPKNLDLAVDWNFPPPEQYDVKAFPDTRFFLGPEYVILPDNFDADRIANRRFKKPVRNILISMGGVDEHNLTTAIVGKIADEVPDAHLTIVLGAGFSGQAGLDAVLRSCGLPHECKQGVTDMFSEYLNCDAAIAAAGTTAFELVATHTPALLIAAYEHQVARCEFFAERGMAVYLGDPDTCKNKNLKAGLARLESFTADNFSMNFHGAGEIFKAVAASQNPGRPF